MLITKDIILKLKPCKDRLDNALKFYNNKSFTPKQFMDLKNITHEDKLWVALRLMPKDNIRLAAADIAESVLYIFENVYPNDLRPRKALEAIRADKVTTQIINDTYAAASRIPNYESAYDAANAVAHATNAAYAIAYAVAATNAVAQAAAAVFADSAHYDADSAHHEDTYLIGPDEYRKKIRTIILSYWKD